MSRQSFNQQYGPWALVTGASSGIGAAFARQLAARGLNVAIAARREDRLQSLAREIEQQHRVQARPIVVDLTAADYLETVRTQTEGLEIGLLVNNAGWGAPGGFLNRGRESHTSTVQLNVEAPTQLAHVFGERMVRRGRGGIIFVSSTAGYMGAPFIASYAATKGYLLNLGAALHVELKPRGVDVLVLSPGPTRTEIGNQEGFDSSKVPMYWMDADPVAAEGLRALGRHSSVIAGGPNRLMGFMMSRVMPRHAAVSMFGNLMAKALDPALR